MKFVTRSVLEQVYKKRDPWSHKGQFGRLLVIAGNEVHTGSAIFVGLAAYRTGCDLVYIVGPRRAMDVASSYSPLLITNPLEGKQLEEKHIPQILQVINETKVHSIVIGPGLWRTLETRKAIVGLIEKINLPMVVDADAIRAISVAKEKLYKKKVLLVPHENEFLELTGVAVSTVIKERIKIVREEAHEINCSSGVCPLVPPVVILLKGHIDVISNGIEVALNKTGTPKLTVGGMGDSLAGIAGAMLARGIDAFTSGCASAYINGKAGEYAVKRYGESTVTTDLIEEIPNAIKNV